MKTLAKAGIIILAISLIGLILITLYINYDSLVDALGNGPPYYGQTENMDKWQNPIPYLMVLDIAVIVVSVLSVRWLRKQLKN